MECPREPRRSYGSRFQGRAVDSRRVSRYRGGHIRPHDAARRLMMGLRIPVMAALMTVAIAACGDSHGHHTRVVPASRITVVDLGTVALTATNQSQTFDVVVHNARSFVIVADGGDATDVDIETLRAPSGTVLVTPNPDDANPLTGGVSPQDVGGSVATAIVPSRTTTPVESGTYTFSVASFGAARTGVPPTRIRVPATVHLTAIIDRRPHTETGRLKVRLFFVGTKGLDADSALDSPAFQAVFHELTRTFAAIGIDVEIADRRNIGGDAGLRLAVLDVLDSTTDRIVPDHNLNRQSDEMDELFGLSPHGVDDAINVFFVDEFVTQSGTDAVSGGAPGPSIVSGTAHSGIAVSTRGGLADQSVTDLEAIGQDLAREVARYLGAQGTVDPGAFTADQALVVRVNPAVDDPPPDAP